MPEGFGQNISPDDNEILLAELRYSDPDRLPALVQGSLAKLDESFYAFLEEKINSSSDIPERETLRLLRDAITDIMKTLYKEYESSNAASDAAPAASAEVADGSAPAIDVSAGGEEIATATYDELIDQLTQAKDVHVAVNASYDRVDLRLLERLGERIAAGKGDPAQLVTVRDAINAAMNERMTRAMESVKTVLAAREPTAMRKEVDLLARKGKIDDAFILLLQANLEQAQKAGAEQAVSVMKIVLDYASAVKEVRLEPEIRLLRSLLRTEDSDARVEMLTEGLKPRATVNSEDGKTTTQVARVNGKKFVTALRRLIEEFGNVDEKFVLKLSQIGEESEKVARKLFDMEGKDVQDLQDEAFHKRTVSVWDLERIEIEQEMGGREAAWEGRLGPIPEAFGEDGKLEV